MIARRKLITGAAAIAAMKMLPAPALALGGGATPDPYILPEYPPGPRGYNSFGGRVQVQPSSLSGSTGCILVFGDSVQSNVVNSTISAAQANNYNFNVYNGGLYKTVEPLLGCNWNTLTQIVSGNVFTGVADTLIANAVYTNVVLVPTGLGGTLIADYAAGGSLNGRFAPVKRRLDAAGLNLTGIYCMLGANDNPNGTSQAAATASFSSIVSTLRAIWPAPLPIFIATHSLFGLTTAANVQNAQAATLNTPGAVYTGGNIDSIVGAGNYWDNTHPNSTGRAAMVSLIVPAITAHP